jgi:hypothetical protein
MNAKQLGYQYNPLTSSIHSNYMEGLSDVLGLYISVVATVGRQRSDGIEKVERR